MFTPFAKLRIQSSDWFGDV